jgi:gliding motility-associated-like protein
MNGGPWLAPTPATATSYTFGNLSAGTYTINVRDQFGCVAVAQPVTINPRLTANAVLTADLTCLADAQVTINTTGGSGIYTYAWSNDGGTNFFNTNFAGNVFTTSSDGTYVFRITDTTVPGACTIISNAIGISPAVLPVISGITASNLTCNGDASGAFAVNIDTNFGLAPYTINVVNNTTAVNYGTQTSGLAAGDYTVTVTDSKGCFVTAPATITEPAVINYTVTDVPITCDSSSSVTNPGSITISGITGGTAEYTYYLTANNGIAPQNYVTTVGNRDHTFNILSFGIYQIDVIDANGCSAYSTQIIASPPNDLDIDVTTLTADCISGGTAIVQVGAAVGSGNYEFAILETFTPPYAVSYVSPDTPGGDTATFTGLTPGITYTFVVYDLTTNCYYFEEADAPINTPSNMTASLDTVANVTCTGAADGNVSFTFDNYDLGATAVHYEIFNAQSNLSTGYSGSSVVNPPAGAISIANFATLAPGEYYLLLSEVGGAFNGCSVYGGEFTIRESVNLLDVNLVVTKNDNCNLNAGIITATGQFGTGPYQYQILPSGSPAPTLTTWAGSSANVFNVESGDYEVYIKDANNCIQFDAITVGLDVRPEISLSVVDECVQEGTFQVLVTLDIAGSSPYQLSVNGGPFQNISFNGSNEYTVSGLSSGSAQTIAVRDLNGCTDTDPFTIQTPLQFNAALTTSLDCEVAPANNAEITISVSAGSGNYDYEISGPVNQARTALPSTNHIWDLASVPGSYTITVYDTSTAVPNCLGSVVVEVPVAIVPVFTETHVAISCFGADDGSIIVSQTDNGINPLTYSINPVAGTFNALTGTFENLPPNTYTITATGTNGCTTDISGIIIDEPAAIANINATVVEFGCTAGNNPNNASITIDGASITGGSGSYVIYEFINNGTASIVQSGTNQTYMETNRVGGNYTINVYDDLGCIGTTTATILPFDEILTATASISNPLSCTPGADGEITISTTSTNSDPTRFEYSIDNGATYVASHIFSGLDMGTYNFLVRHLDTGCVTSTSATLINPNTFDIVVTKLSDVICFGSATGEVTLELVDVTYSSSIDWIIWNTNGTADTADDTAVTNGTFATSGPTAPINLMAGSYLAEIIQSNFPGCSNVEAFTIDGPSAAITGNTAVTEITCVGNDGVIEIIDVAGGWGGYSYFVGTAAPLSAADFVASPRFENLPPNTYEAWVMDMEGCQELIQNTIVLDNPTPISANLQVNQENCTNLEGEIEVINTLGGQGTNYAYQLIKDGVAFGDPQTSTLFSGLGAGSYAVTVTDQWACTFTTAAEILYEEMNVTATVVKLIDCSATPGGEITINVAGGSSNLEYIITFPDATTITNTTGIFTGLTQVGSYSFLVRDLDTTNPICEKTIVESLEAPSTTTLIAATLVDISCDGLSDGSITVNLAPTAPGINEDPVYSYNLYNATGTVLLAGPQTNPMFTGLAAGTYQVEAVSSRECVSVRQNATLTAPSPLQVTVSATPFTCDSTNGINVSTVTAVVTPGGGTTPYFYSIDNINFQSDPSFPIADNGLDQTITVYVTDGKSCATLGSVVIFALNRFTASVSQVAPISCAGPEEVRISVTDNGETTNVYTYELLPVGNPNAIQTGTPAYNEATFELSTVGSYTFRITDTATGCYFDTTPYTIAPYDLIEVVATPTAPVICFGAADGAMTIDVSGVVNGAYDYVVYNGNGTPTTITGSGNTSANPLTIPNLSGGNYFVRVSETGYPACSADSNTITIISPTATISTTVTPLASVTCDNNRGELLVDPTGGYAPYDMVVTNTTTGQIYTATDVQSFVFTGLSAGAYTIAITDSNGCAPTPETITLVPAIPITSGISATPLMLNCYGDTSATVSATGVSGGEGIYQYQLNYYDAAGATIVSTSGPQSSLNFNNLGAGTYSIFVSDGWNCGVETARVTINEPTEVFASLVQVSALTCTTTAEIRLTGIGGTAPYEYSFNGGPYIAMSGGNTHLFPVPAGDYQYSVRDANGCGEILSNLVSIDPVPPLTIAIDASAALINCAGETTASIRATATGGLGNYQYALYADAGLTNLIAGPQTTRDFFNLGAGNYYVRVTSDDCVAVSNVIPVVEPTPLVVTDSFTNATCSGAADGTITVNLSGGSGGYLYAISPNLNQFHTQNVFTGLAGSPTGITYTVIAQDVNGCFEVLEYTIIEPDPVTVATTVLPEICAGSEDGSIALVLSGGTAPYSTSLNSNNSADFVPDQTLFTDLAAGTYVVFVRDAQGCETNTVVEIEAGVNLNATVTPFYECTGDTPISSINVVLEDTTVAADVLYAIDSTDPADMVLEPDFTNISAGNHYLAISHANGCTNTIPFVIQGFQPLTLILEQNNINEITAVAGGGLEDYTFYFGDENNGTDNTFLIRRTDTYTVTLVDANGCEVSAQIFMEFIDIEIPNFFTPNADGNNDLWVPRNQEAFPEILTIIFDRYGREVYRMGLNDPGWDGLYQSTELPTGDYWYVIKLNGAEDDREFVGHFTLYR